MSDLRIYTIEGNTSGGSTLVANGGGVAAKSYDLNYSRIAKIWRPKYKTGEAKKVVNMAKKYIGYLEKKSNDQLEHFTANSGFNNFTIFAKQYAEHTKINAQGQPWCDVFVDEIFIMALGIKRAKELLGDWSAYTPTSSNLLKAAAKFEVVDYTKAKFGDIIFFKNSTRICHTGIIRKNPDGTMAVNTTNAKLPDSVDETYSQSKFIADICKIVGCESGLIQKAVKGTVTLSRKQNPKHGMVLPVQKYLKMLGYYKGVPDREFGKMTEEAVIAYQKDVLKYKKPDGEITAGKNMWRSMLGLKLN